MARTGKTGQSENHYLIAAVGFIRDYHQKSSNDTVYNDEQDGVLSSNKVRRTRVGFFLK